MAFHEYTMSKNPISNRLTPQQETAVNLFLAGKTDAEVAAAIGKTRTTVNVWRNHDPLFIATLNDRQQQIWSSQLNRLSTLVADAVDALHDGLHDTDIKVRLTAAVHILRTTGVYGTAAPGSQETDPAQIADDVYTKDNALKSGVYLGHRSFSGNEMEYDTRIEQQREFFKEERERQIAREIEDTSGYFKAETYREEIAYWEQLLPAYAEIPQAQLDTLDDATLRQLALDFVKTRDVYLDTLKKGLTYVTAADRPVWDDYTKESASKVNAEIERAKSKTDAVLQIFIDTWEQRGRDAADLLDRKKRKKGARNPMLQLHRFRLPPRTDAEPPALSAPAETEKPENGKTP